MTVIKMYRDTVAEVIEEAADFNPSEIIVFCKTSDGLWDTFLSNIDNVTLAVGAIERIKQELLTGDQNA